MKRFCGLLLALVLLCAGASAAGLDSRAATVVMAQLTDAPHGSANVLMEYYPGTRVEVIREADGQYVQVNVGNAGGSLTGFMRKEDLVFGEADIRAHRGLEVCYAWQGWTMYSYCDPLSEVISEDNDTYVYAMGEYGDWIHAEQAAGDEVITGFVRRDFGAQSEKHTGYDWGIRTEPLPGEVTFEEAIAYGRKWLVADGEIANGTDGERVTGEMLDACRVSTQAYYDYESEELIYSVSFIYADRTWEDGLPMLCASVQMWVEGDTIVRYNFGNG